MDQRKLSRAKNIRQCLKTFMAHSTNITVHILEAHNSLQADMPYLQTFQNKGHMAVAQCFAIYIDYKVIVDYI